jgi:hypothetical protein
MNYYVVKESDTGNIHTLDSEWPREEVQLVGLWDVLAQCNTKAEAKAKRLELSK